MSKAIIPIVLIGGIGVATVILMTRKAKAAPPELLSTDNIMQAQSIAELNAYYNLMSESLITGKITLEEYRTLYDVYYERWYELAGGS